MTSSNKRAYLYTSIAVFFWSTVATAFKIGLTFMNSGTMVFFSSAFSSVALGVVLLARRKPVPLPLRVCIKGAVLGLMSPFLYYLILFRAYSLLPAQEAQPLNFTWPIVLVLLSTIFLGERLTLRDMVSMVICFFGAWVVSSHGAFSGIHFSSIPGTILALGSSIFWSVYWILNRSYRGDKTVILFLSLLAGTVYTAIYLLITGTLQIPPIGGFAAAVYIGLFEMGITFLIWSKALEYTESAALISNFLFLAPFISLIFIALILKEPIAPSTIIGLVLIVSGILFQKLKK